MFNCSHQPTRFGEITHNLATSFVLDDTILDLAIFENYGKHIRDHNEIFKGNSKILQEFKDEYLSKYIGIFLKRNSVYDFLQMNYAQKQREFSYQPKSLDEAILVSNKLRDNDKVTMEEMIKLRNFLGNIATYYFNNSSN